MRILYVEDNPANVFLVKRVARMGNHEVVNLMDGDHVLNQFDTLAPDLVLMDVQLVGNLTGLDVVRQLRQRGIKTPIIAVTAYAMVGDRERCIEAGCDDYMAKPLPIQRLVEVFAHHDKEKSRTTAEVVAIAKERLGIAQEAVSVPTPTQMPVQAPTQAPVAEPIVAPVVVPVAEPVIVPSVAPSASPNADAEAKAETPEPVAIPILKPSAPERDDPLSTPSAEPKTEVNDAPEGS